MMTPEEKELWIIDNSGKHICKNYDTNATEEFEEESVV